MKNLMRVFFMTSFAMLVASCDLQPKIASIPDSVGDFIYERYPALLADPETEAEIYNSAATDYGIYDATDSFENNATTADYLTYANPDDYIAPSEDLPSDYVQPMELKETAEIADEPEMDITIDNEPEIVVPDDVLEIPESKQTAKKLDDSVVDVLVVPAEIKGTEEIVGVKDSVVVQKGDTLFSIAKKNNTNVQDLAKINNLNSPYTVKIGQKIKLRSAADIQSNTTKTHVKEVVKDANQTSKKEIKKPVPEKQNVEPIKSKDVPKVTEKPKSEAKTEQQKRTKSDVKQQPKSDTKVDKKIEKEASAIQITSARTKTITIGHGDTLYSVSRRYAVPVNDLAVMNNLRPPFDLKTGQVLRVPDVPEAKIITPSLASTTKEVVKPNAKSEAKPKESQKQGQNVQKNEKPKTEIKKTTQKVEKKEVNKQDKVKKTKQKKIENKKIETKKTEQKTKDVKKPDTTKNTVKNEKPKQENQVSEKKKISSDPKQKLPQISARSSSKFTWPVRGKVLSNYGAKSGGLFNDGINVGAALNTNVVAAENGVVAYAGNEVKGMGNLIIIQHADGWMTVYAHLNSMSVRRGARVSVGQKIGTVGKTGKVTQPQLHFEIRKGTKAYNPINYLKK